MSSLAEQIRSAAAAAPAKVRIAGNRGVIAFGQQFQTAAAPTYNNVSWHFGFMVPAQYAAVRAVIRNQEAAGYTLNALGFAPSTNVTTPITTGSPTAVTFGGASSVAVPARLAANRPSITYSDWANVQAVAASNGSGYYPLHSRAYIATGPSSVSGASTTISQWNEAAASPLIAGHYAFCTGALGDYVSSNWAGYTGYDAIANSVLTPILEYQFLTLQQVMTVCGLGDSIMWGGGGTLNMVGAGHLACAAVNTAARPVFWQNASVPSTTTSQFVQRLKDMLAAGDRPHVLVYSAFSRNDGTPTATTIAINRYNLVVVLDLCTQYGIIPIIDTGTAETTAAWNATADNLRKGFVNEVRALRNQGVLVLDSDSVLSDGATPARYIASKTTDGTHPNDAGQAAVKTLLVPLLRMAMQRVFA